MNAPDLTALLEHASWVRALATRVARDDEDDAVQELWLSALRSPPDPTRPARPWLARVLVNAARKRFREAETRARNESSAPSMDEPMTPECALARAEAHRMLVEAVLALDEPFRQTVLLRYFDGLSGAEIARRLNVPEGTVRWRLKAALDRLRALLDERHGGKREPWLLAVTPLLLPQPERWFAAGVTLVNEKVRAVVVVAGLVLLAVLGLLVDWPATSAGPHAPRPNGPGSTLVTGGAPVTSSASAASPDAPTRPLSEVTPVARSPAAVNEPGDAGAILGEALFPARLPTGVAIDAGRRYGLDPDGLRAAIRSAMPQVKECYEAWLRVEPHLRGTLVARLVIETEDGVEGRISRLAGVDGGTGLGNAALEGCVLASFSDLRFEPPLDGPLTVTYPLRFEVDAGR